LKKAARNPIRTKKAHPYPWLRERLEKAQGFVEKKMFGCWSAYIDDILMLVMAEGDEPWNGVMVATAVDHHDSLRKDFPVLQPHPILGKWLYISQGNPEFEEVADRLTTLALQHDSRIGVAPKPRKTRHAAKKERLARPLHPVRSKSR
jgi:hypothetical protein